MRTIALHNLNPLKFFSLIYFD